MKLRNIGLMAFLILAAISVVALAQDDTSAASQDSASVSAISDTNGSASVETASFQGIWTASLAGTDITMAINQSGDSISGKCKFEGSEPWNGVLAGTISGRIVNIAVAALQGNVLVSTEIAGTVQDDSLKGSFVRSDSDGNFNNGDVTGTLISPDISEYTPAKVQSPQPQAQAATQASTHESSQTTSIQQTQQVQQQPEQLSAQQTRNQYKDVTQAALGLNPNILPRNFPL